MRRNVPYSLLPNCHTKSELRTAFSFASLIRFCPIKAKNTLTIRVGRQVNIHLAVDTDVRRFHPPSISELTKVRVVSF